MFIPNSFSGLRMTLSCYHEPRALRTSKGSVEMKYILWTSALALSVAACLTACDDSSSDSSYEIPSYKNEADLPDSCNMEVAKVDTAYYACFENKWVAVTDSAAVEQLKEGLDEKEIKAKLEDLENLLIKSSSSSEKLASSSSAAEKPDDNNDSGDAEGDSSSSVKSSSSKVKRSSSSEKNSGGSVEEVIDCSGKTAKAGKQNMSVTVDGKKRTFIMYVPSSYKGDKPVPLFVDYHQIGGSGSGQYSSTKYRSKTDPEGVITLYPDGTSKGGGGMGNLPGWNVGPCCSDDDDVKFSREMIAAVEEIACIDKKRVYAAGYSMGGGMANQVACSMADVFAAVAPAGMDLNRTNSARCSPDRPISIIMFRGTADNVCKYQGGDSGYNDGLNFLGAQLNFEFWAQKNGCTGSPSKNSDGCDEYSNCKDGTKVVLCTKQGGGHEQGDANIGWPFLKQFTLP